MRTRKKSEIRISKEILPLLAAVCLLTCACVCMFIYVGSSSRQAGRVLEKVYTADSSWIPGEEEENGLEEIYFKKLGSMTTYEGMDHIKRLGLPCGFMGAEPKVEKTYADLQLMRPDSKKKDSSDENAVYTYEMQVDVYYDKGMEVMQPVETQYYSGSVRMKKTGLSGWKLDQMTGERIR